MCSLVRLSDNPLLKSHHKQTARTRHVMLAARLITCLLKHGSFENRHGRSLSFHLPDKELTQV